MKQWEKTKILVHLLTIYLMCVWKVHFPYCIIVTAHISFLSWIKRTNWKGILLASWKFSSPILYNFLFIFCVFLIPIIISYISGKFISFFCLHPTKMGRKGWVRIKTLQSPWQLLICSNASGEWKGVKLLKKHSCQKLREYFLAQVDLKPSLDAGWIIRVINVIWASTFCLSVLDITKLSLYHSTGTLERGFASIFDSFGNGSEITQLSKWCQKTRCK